jgi:hypothetical protein
MPISFLTPAQRENYGRYAATPTPDQLSRFFHLSDDDLREIRICRGEHNRLGFALQLSAVRYLGTFPDDPVAVPAEVVQTLAHQLDIVNPDALRTYGTGKQRWDHAARIQISFGYSDITEPRVGFRLTRWLYVLCWTGTERPSVLFDRAVAWLLAHKILLPGCSTLERFVLRVRARVEGRVWHLLGRGIRPSQRKRLEGLLAVPEGRRGSLLDQIRSGPTRASGPAMNAAIDRLKTIRGLGIVLPALQHIPESRLASLASFANRAKVSLITRMPQARRLATLVAFVQKVALLQAILQTEKDSRFLKTGYARVSTLDQNLEPQLRTLKKAGCQKIFREKASGASRQRPEFQRMLDQIRPGDIIVVWKLDRLARSTRDLLNTMETISEAGAKFESLSEPWANTTTHVGKMDHDSLRPASRNLRGI